MKKIYPYFLISIAGLIIILLSKTVGAQQSDRLDVIRIGETEQGIIERVTIGIHTCYILNQSISCLR